MSRPIHRWLRSRPAITNFVRQLLFACSALIGIFLVLNAFTTTSASASPTYNPSSTARNADLLSYKMFFEADDVPSLLLPPPGRVQRHIHPGKKRRHRKRKRRMRKGGFIPLPKDNSSASVLSFKELKPAESIILGPAPPQLQSDNGRGFCKTVPFSQLINVTGCAPTHITNRYCYGACNSFYIPSDDGQRSPFASCQSCVPKRFIWKTVKLSCGSDADLKAKSSDDDNRITVGVTSRSARKEKAYMVRVVAKCKCTKIDMNLA